MSMIGKSLVHYEISAQIGRGGMGEVYKDTDMFKLNVDEAQELYTEWFGPDSRSDQTTEANTEA